MDLSVVQEPEMNFNSEQWGEGGRKTSNRYKQTVPVLLSHAHEDRANISSELYEDILVSKHLAKKQLFLKSGMREPALAEIQSIPP